MRCLIVGFVITAIALSAGAQTCDGGGTDILDPPPGTPIVINFGNGGYDLTGLNDPVFFDITAVGTPQRIGWTAASADVAFLWRDINHNGTVDNGGELFGNATLMKNGQRAPNGFEALKAFDGNGDGVIDAKDAIWTELLLWRDLNHNGIAEKNEITRVSDSGLSRIELQYHFTRRRDASGNMFWCESLVSIRDRRGAVRSEPVYDVVFVRGQ